MTPQTYKKNKVKITSEPIFDDNRELCYRVKVKRSFCGIPYWKTYKRWRNNKFILGGSWVSIFTDLEHAKEIALQLVDEENYQRLIREQNRF